MIKDFEKITCVLTANDGIGGLYLGSYDIANNREQLNQSNIKSIVTVAHGLYPSHDGIIIKHFAIFDVSSQNILQNYKLYLPFYSPILNEACNFISKCMKSGITVLVHCMAGQSRSATIVIGFLMYWKNWDYNEAYHYVKQIRSIIQPNLGFTKQLYIWENQLFQFKQSKL